MKKHLIPSILICTFLLSIGCGNEKVEKTESIPIPTAEVEEEIEKIDITEEELALTIDPVCGMPAFKFLVDTAIYQEKTYGFCGTGCKDAFVESPDEYLEKLN